MNEGLDEFPGCAEWHPDEDGTIGMYFDGRAPPATSNDVVCDDRRNVRGRNELSRLLFIACHEAAAKRI